MKIANAKLFLLHLMASTLASYRRGPVRPELDRLGLPGKRIALVKLDGIGDFILATGVLRVIERELPEADITYFCRKPVGELARQQFSGWEVVEVPWPGQAGKKLLLDGKTRRWIKARRPFDVLLDLRTFRDFTETTMASWIPARQKIAPINTQRPAQWWWHLPDEKRIYDQLLRLAAVNGAGLPLDLQNHQALAGWLFPDSERAGEVLPRLAVDPGAIERVAVRLETEFQLHRNAPFLLVCPGTSTTIKEYPVTALAEAIMGVIGSMSMPVIIAGGPADARTTKPLYALLQNRCMVFDLSGMFGLAEHLALVSLSRAVLSMDTCHAHFAGAIGKPAVVVLGGGHFGWFAPWGDPKTFRWLSHDLPCFGCNWACIHDRPICIHDISPDLIAKNLIEILTLRPEVRDEGR